MLLGSNLRFGCRNYAYGRKLDQTVFRLLGGCRCRSKNSFNSVKNANQIDKSAFKRSTPPNQMRSSKIIKPTIFTLLFSSASFGGAAIWQYENIRSRAKELLRSPNSWLADKAFSSNLWREKFGEYSAIRTNKRVSFRQLCNTAWNSLSEAQKTFLPILFANVLVYAAWKVSSIRPLMMKYFVSCPTSKHSCWPLFLSTFSHLSILHLLANMLVLNSFITALVPNLGKEQFVAFYFSAGVISSLFSYTYKILLKDAAMSLGASGAIMGVIGYSCVKHPDNLLSVIFIPFFVFKASTGLKAIMAVDFTCLLMKFKILDHMAHLAGASFGIFWHFWGNEHIWQKRGPLLEYWHKLRNSFTKF